MYSINPAYAGQDNNIHIGICYKKQWIGINGQFQSFYFDAYTKLGERPPKIYNKYSLRISQPSKYSAAGKLSEKKVRHGAGILISNDHLGPSSRFNAGFSYAAHYRFNDKIKIAAAFSLGIVSFSFNDEGIVLANPMDETYTNYLSQNGQASFLNVNTGLLCYSAKWELAYSAHQVLGNQIWFRNNDDLSKIKVHHYVSGSYLINVKEDLISIKPGFLLKYVTGLEPNIEANALILFKKNYWLGTGYRLSNGMFTCFGLNYKNMRIGYSFNLNTNALINYSSGSHEVFIGFIL